MLIADNLTCSFGGVKAVDQLSFVVNQGDIFSIIGPNGAGKTTVLNLFSRFYNADMGEIWLEDDNITKISASAVAKKGIARTFQNVELFERETVLQNLLIAQHIHRTTNLVTECLFVGLARRQEIRFREVAEHVIDLLHLEQHRDATTGSLPFGVRKLVEIGRALCLRPRLLLMDEPSSGLNPEETEDLGHWIEDINQDLDVTIVMVEHDMSLIGRVASRVLAMADGRLLTIGTPKEVENHPEVIEAYLGC